MELHPALHMLIQAYESGSVDAVVVAQKHCDAAGIPEKKRAAALRARGLGAVEEVLKPADKSAEPDEPVRPAVEFPPTARRGRPRKLTTDA